MTTKNALNICDIILSGVDWIGLDYCVYKSKFIISVCILSAAAVMWPEINEKSILKSRNNSLHFRWCVYFLLCLLLVVFVYSIENLIKLSKHAIISLVDKRRRSDVNRKKNGNSFKWIKKKTVSNFQLKWLLFELSLRRRRRTNLKIIHIAKLMKPHRIRNVIMMINLNWNRM